MSDFLNHISDISSAWRMAGYALCILLAIVTVLANKKFRKIGKWETIAILVAIIIIFITPTLADAWANHHKPDSKVTVEVHDPSRVVHTTHDLLITNSLNKPTQTVDNEYEFTFKTEELTQDSSITITAQTNDKCFIGDTTIKISGYQNYKAILILKQICDTHRIPPPKTFSLNFNSPAIINKIRDTFHFAATDKSADYKISLAVDNDVIQFDSDDHSWSVNECYPVISINGITCTKVNCCKIDGTDPVKRKEIVTEYINHKLRAIPESCYSQQINKIIAWIRNH